MGFFNNVIKGLNPLNHLKNPKEGMKHFVGSIVDPAGTTIREGRGKSALTGSIKDYYDPGGAMGGKPQAAPNSYTPQRPLQLSAGAQALYDDMRARTAARAAGQQYSRTPMQPQAAPQVAPPMRQPMPYQPPAPQMLADGGMVGDDRDVYYESKAFERKPNGKPY